MSSRIKTLVVLTPAFPAGEEETNWVVTQQLFVRTLAGEYPGLHIEVICLYYPATPRVYTWKGVQVTSFESRRYRRWKRVLFWGKVWRRLKQIRRAYDVIGLFSFWCGECALLGGYFGRRYRIKHLCWLCGQDARETNRLVKYIRPKSNELIGMSDFLVDEFERCHGIRPAYMIPNGIEPQPAAANQERSVDLLGVGSLSRIKRYDLFVEIVAGLRKEMPFIRAALCGDGEDMEYIKALISDHRLGDHLHLMGEQRHEVALATMRNAKVLLHPSSYEGFGVVCLEALAAGARVISFTRPMKADIPGWHIVGSPEEMMAKAADLLRDAPDHQAVIPFTMRDTVRSVMQIYGYDKHH